MKTLGCAWLRVDLTCDVFDGPWECVPCQIVVKFSSPVVLDPLSSTAVVLYRKMLLEMVKTCLIDLNSDRQIFLQFFPLKPGKNMQL